MSSAHPLLNYWQQSALSIHSSRPPLQCFVVHLFLPWIFRNLMTSPMVWYLQKGAKKDHQGQREHRDRQIGGTPWDSTGIRLDTFEIGGLWDGFASTMDFAQHPAICWRHCWWGIGLMVGESRFLELSLLLLHVVIDVGWWMMDNDNG